MLAGLLAVFEAIAVAVELEDMHVMTAGRASPVRRSDPKMRRPRRLGPFVEGHRSNQVSKKTLGRRKRAHYKESPDQRGH